jgi:hypothetical protein
MKLTNQEIAYIRQAVDASGIKRTSLRDDILDHLCCVLESEGSKRENFDLQLQRAIIHLAPYGLKQLENETVRLLHYNRLKVMKKIMYTTGFLGALATTGGVMFKLLHWPGADELFVVGYILLLLVFVPLSVVDRFKVILTKALPEKLRAFTGVIAALAGGMAGIFKIMHLPGADLLLITGALVFGFGFLPFLFFTLYKKSIA